MSGRRGGHKKSRALMGIGLTASVLMATLLPTHSPFAQQGPKEPEGYVPPPGYPTFQQLWKLSQKLNPQYSTDMTRIGLEIEGTNFAIPRNYLIHPPLPEGGGAAMKVIFPGFKPYSLEMAPCFTPKSYRPPMNCFPVEFWLKGKGNSGSGSEIFERSKPDFKSKTPILESSGFERYHSGPPIEGGMDYFRMVRDHGDLVFLECNIYANLPWPDGGCTDTFDYKQSIIVRFTIYKSQITHAVEIQDGLKKLISEFEVK